MKHAPVRTVRDRCVDVLITDPDGFGTLQPQYSSALKRLQWPGGLDDIVKAAAGAMLYAEQDRPQVSTAGSDIQQQWGLCDDVQIQDQNLEEAQG
jgi:hypothetical protein